MIAGSNPAALIKFLKEKLVFKVCVLKKIRLYFYLNNLIKQNSVKILFSKC